MIGKLTQTEQACFDALLDGWADNPRTEEMEGFIQHGSVTTYEHCMRVAQISFWLNRRLNLHADEVSLVRGAFLHDFYLYDWHRAPDNPHSLFEMHGYTHPATALKNAEAAFELNDTMRDIIRSHMWPLTLRCPPHTREGAIVCMADKLSSTQETVTERHSTSQNAAGTFKARAKERAKQRAAELEKTRAVLKAQPAKAKQFSQIKKKG